MGALVCILLAAYATWYSTAGRFTVVPPARNDYADLGDAFLHGQLSLREAPNPQLAALPNPYDYTQRLSLAYRWDASYYGGKYYLYWGPVPGIVSAGVEAILGAPPSGVLLVLIGYVGLLAVLLGLLIHISGGLFDADSSLSIGLFVLLGLMNLPMLFLLGQPRIYEASIIYGQLFLLTGVLGWALYGRTNKTGWLALAGLSWGLAVGCRYNLLLSVVVFAILGLVVLIRESGSVEDRRKSGALLAPLALCFAALAIYNTVRFGSPLETGYSYQLTITQPPDPYSAAYFLSNLYIYVSYPITTVGKFPFVRSALFDPAHLPGWLHLPASRQFDHIIIGLLPTVPGLWLMALGIPAAVMRRKAAGQVSARAALDVLPWMIGIAAAAQFLYIMVFFYGAERYAADFYPSLILIIAMLTWKIDEKLRNRPWLRLALWLAVVGLTVWTAGIAFFGGFGIPPRVFRANNPDLYAQLASYWDDRYATLQAVLNKIRGLLAG